MGVDAHPSWIDFLAIDALILLFAFTIIFQSILIVKIIGQLGLRLFIILVVVFAVMHEWGRASIGLGRNEDSWTNSIPQHVYLNGGCPDLVSFISFPFYGIRNVGFRVSWFPRIILEKSLGRSVLLDKWILAPFPIPSLSNPWIVVSIFLILATSKGL